METYVIPVISYLHFVHTTFFSKLSIKNIIYGKNILNNERKIISIFYK